MYATDDPTRGLAAVNRMMHWIKHIGTPDRVLRETLCDPTFQQGLRSYRVWFGCARSAGVLSVGSHVC